MWAHGLKERIADLDVVAWGSAWATARRLGAVEAAPYQGCRAVHLFGGAIEVLDRWFPHWFAQEDLFGRTELISGLSFVNVEDTLAWKRRLRRQKDLADVALALRRDPARGRPDEARPLAA
ncbi:hypothetical protein [Saccharothrix sp. HUAS TT1]|uniref:hypothetical protein n=1 Tax=unclassified Saccharothrix TaxID=2593673 RepID=UPI00345C1823